ncbi:PaaI family thioesterase [Hydrogenophaga sp.]|uniref:PaaI family thioesterase n=1 Tax=Hydrogenophaga sp. TaxID=1904254 RepID=UPI0025C735DD|nr:PaaI family thioesterase [Hydrogenophaga sp.]
MLNSEAIDRLHAQGWKSRQLDGFMGHSGPLWTRREGDGWVYGLLAEDKHLNPAGVVHGGALATLIDHVVSTVAWEACGRTPCVTVQLDTHFLAEVRAGDFALARASITARTGSLVFVDGLVQVEGQAVLTARGVMKMLRPARMP